MHYLVQGSIEKMIVAAPMIIGHEASRIVKNVERNLTNLKVNDRVAIESGGSCRFSNF